MSIQPKLFAAYGWPWGGNGPLVRSFHHNHSSAVAGPLKPEPAAADPDMPVSPGHALLADDEVVLIEGDRITALLEPA